MGVFQDRVRSARIRAGFRTPEACAARMELGINTIRRWEDGTTTAPDIGLVRDFCDLVKVSTDWLIGRTDRRGLR